MSLEDLAAGLDDLSRNREALALLILQGQQAAPLLAEVLLGPPSSIPDARCLAAEALGAIGGEAAISALIRVLSLHDLRSLDAILRLAEEAVRNRAAEDLGNLGNRRAWSPCSMPWRTNGFAAPWGPSPASTRDGRSPTSLTA